MNKFLLIISLLILISGCTQQTNLPTNIEQINLTKYTDANGKFSIGFPQGWERQNMSFFDVSFGFVNQESNELKLIGVSVNDVDDVLSPNQALDLIKSALGSNNNLIELSRGFDNKGTYLEFTTNFSEMAVKGKILVIIEGKKIFSAMYLSNIEEYNKNLKQAEASLNSLEVKI